MMHYFVEERNGSREGGTNAIKRNSRTEKRKDDNKICYYNVKRRNNNNIYYCTGAACTHTHTHEIDGTPTDGTHILV